jgi:hypothetical protein
MRTNKLDGEGDAVTTKQGMQARTIDYTNAYVGASGSRWIVASNPAHYSGIPEVLEIHPDETVTLWQYCGRVSPCIGTSGPLSGMKPGTTLKHVTNAKERELVAHKERCIAKGVEMSQLQYDRMKGVRP